MFRIFCFLRTVDVPSLNAFKKGLSMIRDNRMGFFMDKDR